MNTIWKFPLEIADTQILAMPRGAKILHVAEQGNAVCLWAQVEPTAPKQDRIIHIYGTGHPMPAAPGDHIGSFLLLAGALVFHAFVEPIP